MQRWNWFNKNGVRYISIEDWLKDGINMAFSARQGGTSSGAFNSLNMGLHVGDESIKVIENRQRFLNIFEVGLDSVVCCQQVHGQQVSQVHLSDQGRGAYELSGAIPDTDAMITNVRGLHLFSFYADCVPVYFNDPINRAVGIAHCGWKGTMGRIAVRTIQAMQHEYHSSLEQVQIFIGPGIGPCCFEIQADLLAKVNAEFGSFHDIINIGRKSPFTWDLKETNRQQLLHFGVEPSHIETCNICTACNTDYFYSYRSEKGETGRMGAVIGLID